MKVLILSCSTGGGHNSCAKYILDELKSNNIECEFKDFFDVVNEKAKNLSSKIYLKTLGNNGKIFKTMYKLGELYSKTKIKSPVYLFNKVHKRALYKYIKDYNFDLVIATHLFPGLSLTAINKDNKDKKYDKVKFIMVATDYEPCPFLEEVKPNYLVIPKDLDDKCTKRGIDKNILLQFGIPISSKFINEAKDIRHLYNIKDEKVILIMLGSMGFGKIENIIYDLLNENNIKIIVVCGSNKELFNKLNKINDNKLIVLGFTNNVNDLIYSSDIVLSKPGGLSTTEIATLNKPLLHIFAIPGIETYNANFFSNRNMSIKCMQEKEIINNVKLLLKNKKLVKDLINNQSKYINKYSAKELCDFIKK